MPQSLKGKGEEVLREAVGKRGIRYFCCKQAASEKAFEILEFFSFIVGYRVVHEE